MKKFNVQPTLEAFNAVKDVMKKNNLLSYAVHKSVLEDGWFRKFQNHLRQDLEHLEGINTEVLLPTYIGKVAKRIPNGVVGTKIVDGKKVKTKWDDFQLEEAKKIAAAILVNVLIDSGEYELVKRTERVNPEYNQGKLFITRLFLVFDGVLPLKELAYGLETEPGIYYQKTVGDQHISAKFKYYLDRVSRFAFKTSDVMTFELLMHGYKLSKDYNSKNPNGRGEHYLIKRKRYESTARNIIRQLAVLPKFFLPMKYDSRSRMYYLFQLVGIRPHGHLWETLFIDAFTPKVLGKSAIKHLRHIIYVAKYGRCSVEHSDKYFNMEDHFWASSLNPLDVKPGAGAEKEFGIAILMNKAARAIEMCKSGTPCHYLFGKDLTNSGLMMAAACFKSPKMLKMANLRKLKTVHDSHTDLQAAYGLDHLTRDDMKKISTPMLHGSGIRSLVKNVQSALLKHGENEHVVDSIDEAFISMVNHEAFGPEVENIFAISSWGADAVSNMQTVLRWRTPDGFKAYHRAHIEYCPVIVTAATMSVKARYRESKLVFDMPLKQQSNGQSLYARGTVATGAKHPVKVSKTGLYANITHGIDASLEREIIDLVDRKEEVALFKHDDYIVFADCFDEVIEVGQKFFLKASVVNYYQQALEMIVQFGKNLPSLPELKIGKGKVEKSVNYLMP